MAHCRFLWRLLGVFLLLVGVCTIGPSAAHSAPRPDPSGVAAPNGSLPGWQLTYVDDFTGSRLDARWFRYVGIPGGDPAGRFAASHVSVSGGALHINGYRDNAFGGKFATGGVSSHVLAQTYGKWVVRFRMDAGQGISYAALLWPDSTSWPPEIDFAEDNGVAARPTITASLLYRTVTNRHGAVRATRRTSLTAWHTVGVEWRPGSITYTVDGVRWARMTGAHVPTVPMRLGLQTQAWGCRDDWEHCPNRTTPRRVDMQVDWVAVYRLA